MCQAHLQTREGVISGGKRKIPQAFNLMQTQGKYHHIKINYIQVLIKKHELTLYTS